MKSLRRQGLGYRETEATAAARPQPVHDVPEGRRPPVSYLARAKQAHGFQTGDRVCANIPRGKHQGRHSGRVAIRQHGAFVIQTGNGKVEANWRHCRIVQRNDGYDYTQMNSFH